MNHKRTAFWAFAAAASLVITACASTPSKDTAATPTDSSAAAVASHADDNYIFVSSMGNLEYFNAIKYGWQWAGKTLGVKTSFVGPAENDVNAEATAFQQAIAQKPTGIAVFAYDPVLQPLINKAVEAGIPVVTAVGDLPGSERIAYVGSDQYQVGITGGTHLGQALNGQGKVAILGIPGTAMFDQRAQGYKDALAKFPGIQVVQEGDTKADEVTAVNVAKAILQRFPDLNAFAAVDSTGGMGGATAVKEAGKTAQVKVVSMDRNSDVLGMIQDGSVFGTVAQEDPGIAFWALQALFNYVHNPSPLVTDPAAAHVVTGPSTISMHANWVDKSNVQYFLDQNKVFKQ